MQTIREIITIVEMVLTSVFSLLFFYQFFYTVYVLFSKEREKPLLANKLHKFGVIVSARNEEQVIGQLLDSIKKQNYPPELVRMLVVADNCTDRTADIARSFPGVLVYEKSVPSSGKGDVLAWGIDIIRSGG